MGLVERASGVAVPLELLCSTCISRVVVFSPLLARGYRPEHAGSYAVYGVGGRTPGVLHGGKRFLPSTFQCFRPAGGPSAVWACYSALSRVWPPQAARDV